MIRVAVLGAVVAAAGCGTVGEIPGSLPGHAQTSFDVTVSQVTATSVTAAGAPSEREGTLSIARYGLGLFAGGTKFGSLTAIEVETTLGYLSGDAASLEDGTPKSTMHFGSELGGAVQPLNIKPGPLQLRLTGDFGVGFTLDDRYTYAGGRVAVGAKSKRFTLDATAHRRFGDTPGNPSAHEDRARVTLTIRPRARRPLLVLLGVELVRGDQRTLDATGAEQARDDYLLRGRYDMMSLTLGLGAGDP